MVELLLLCCCRYCYCHYIAYERVCSFVHTTNDDDDDVNVNIVDDDTAFSTFNVRNRCHGRSFVHSYIHIFSIIPNNNNNKILLSSCVCMYEFTFRQCTHTLTYIYRPNEYKLVFGSISECDDVARVNMYAIVYVKNACCLYVCVCA